MKSANSVEISSLDLSAMRQLATAMVAHLPKHLVIGLVGTLGAGKTTLVQAIAKAAAIDPANVTSPTFTLLQTHHGTITLHHLDAYRLADEDEFLELGVDELLEDREAWTIVEWADRVVTVMPRETLWVEIQVSDVPSRRSVILTTAEPETRAALDLMMKDLGLRS